MPYLTLTLFPIQNDYSGIITVPTTVLHLLLEFLTATDEQQVVNTAHRPTSRYEPGASADTNSNERAEESRVGSTRFCTRDFGCSFLLRQQHTGWAWGSPWEGGVWEEEHQQHQQQQCAWTTDWRGRKLPRRERQIRWNSNTELTHRTLTNRKVQTIKST